MIASADWLPPMTTAGVCASVRCSRSSGFTHGERGSYRRRADEAMPIGPVLFEYVHRELLGNRNLHRLLALFHFLPQRRRAWLCVLRPETDGHTLSRFGFGQLHIREHDAMPADHGARLLQILAP